MFSIVFVAICVYAQYVLPKEESTKVQKKETDISIIFEEDGNTSKTRKVDTITRLPVPTPHIRVASFKASPGLRIISPIPERQAEVALILPGPRLLLVLDREEDE